MIASPTAAQQIAALTSGRKSDPTRAKKVAKAIRLLSENPQHPGLHTHRYEAMDAFVGETVWESYVENMTSGAWRIWWFFGPQAGQITVPTSDRKLSPRFFWGRPGPRTALVRYLSLTILGGFHHA